NSSSKPRRSPCWAESSASCWALVWVRSSSACSRSVLRFPSCPRPSRPRPRSSWGWCSASPRRPGRRNWIPWKHCGMSDQVELLAIAAHRDDVELTCGGTLAKAVKAGHRVGILDLTQGEMGTRGDAATRAAEAERAAKTLGVAARLNAGLRDAPITNDDDSRSVLVALIRRMRPRVVILPFPVGRHPDHRIASELGRDACYLAGLVKFAPGAGGEAHRPPKILYSLAYRE